VTGLGPPVATSDGLLQPVEAVLPLTAAATSALLPFEPEGMTQRLEAFSSALPSPITGDNMQEGCS